ncbi:response regulator [bacterium]|nr:response regulator [bacterium]RQV93812.1 MAG: response regulator [bacterium]
MAKILIADDQDVIRSTIVKIIQKMNHVPVEAKNGREAWEIFQDGSIALSIVDIKMPEMSGIDFLKKAKALDPNAIIIMLTGYPSAETIVETIEEDGYTYITKPIEMEQMMDLVNRGLSCREQRIGERKASEID